MADGVSKLIAKPGQPEAAAALAHQHGVVFHHRNANLRQSRARAGDVVPPVVIAEDGMNAKRRAQPRQFRRPGGGRHMLGDETMRGEEIAEQHDEIGGRAGPPGGVSR